MKNNNLKISDINSSLKILCLTVAICTLTNNVFADDDPCCTGHIKAFAPASVMGAHLHKKGESMFGYSYMYGAMSQGKPAGTSLTSPHDHDHDSGHGGEEDSGHHHEKSLRHGDEHHDDTPSASTSHQHTMQHQMHMLEGMYGVSDNFNIMAMVPLVQQRMNHRMPGEEGFSTENNGIGDVSLTGLHSLYRGDNSLLHAGFGMSFPTADIDDTDIYHGVNSNHPYMMQVGSGTFDLLPSLTYQETFGKFGWGLQGSMVNRLGRNNNDYALGDRYNVTTWAGYELAPRFRLTSRVTAKFWDDVTGMDDDILIKSKMADPRSQGGNLIEAGIGGLYSFYAAGLGHSVGIEAGFPITQEVDSGWMNQDWMLTTTWRVVF
jgi:hypothetical protein